MLLGEDDIKGDILKGRSGGQSYKGKGVLGKGNSKSRGTAVQREWAVIRSTSS